MCGDIYMVLVAGNEKHVKFLFQNVGRFVGKWHKPEGVKFELPYNKKMV